MRTAKAEARAVVLETLNLLLGGNDANNDLFWELTMQLQLRSKYGCYAGVFSSKEAFASVRSQTNLQLLYMRLLFVLGLECSTKLSYSFLHENPPSVPFSGSCKLVISARIKSVIASTVKTGLLKAVREGATVREERKKKETFFTDLSLSLKDGRFDCNCESVSIRQCDSMRV